MNPFSKPSRREFLRRAALGVAGLSTIKAVPFTSTAKAASTHAKWASSPIPGHRPIDLQGVHAYPMEHSIAAGETLELCVSASVPYSMTICRLGNNVDDPNSDTILAHLPDQPPTPQPIHTGSYVHVERGLKGPFQGLTLECWIRPWDLTKLQGLISQEDKESYEGFALGIGNEGYVGFYLGDGIAPDEKTVHRTAPQVITRNKWNHVVATWDGSMKRVYVNGKEIVSWVFQSVAKPGPHPLRLGAMAEKGLAQHFLDGDIAMPAVYSRALTPEEIESRYQSKGLTQATGSHVLACWPLNEEKGDLVEDASKSNRHGRIINHGTWMIGGPSFKAEVTRFGKYDPRKDSGRGHGLRLASDDLYDCRWKVTHHWTVPPDATSGIYVARMIFNHGGKERWYHCTFLVRKAPRKRKAPILFICATNTWRAYNGTPFALTPPELKQVWGTGGIGREPNLPAYCLYRAHAAGQGTYQLGLRVPWPAAGPYVLYGGATEYSHLMRADRFPQTWLEEQGYSYDLISDVDLHRDPSVLRGYKVLMVVGHNEYWSLQMYRGVQQFLNQGGNLMVLSGNTLGWRVSFNEDCSVMECRKVDAPGDQVPKSRRGEAWHSHDGMRGGPARECGMPGVELIGLDIIGWNHQSNPKNFGPYLVEDDSHFLFNTPEKSGLKKGDAFGWGGPGKMPMANGHEVDIRPSTFAALQTEPTPEGAVMPKDPPGMVRIANGVLPWKEGGQPMDYFWRVIKPKTDQGGEMIYWERPTGGKVFNAGAIGSGWTLHADPKWAAVARNVLHHFGVPAQKK